MELREFKTVSLPINIPISNYCYKRGQTTCVQVKYDEEGRVTCDAGFIIADENGIVHKPAGCRELDDCL